MFLFAPYNFRVLCRFYRRNFGCNLTRTGAGEKNSNQRKQRRCQENQRGSADGGNAGTKRGSCHYNRCQRCTDSISQQQSCGNACNAQKHCLLAYHAAKLPGGDTDGFQQAIKSNIPGNGNLKNVVDNQIPCENHQCKERNNRQERCCVHAFAQLRRCIAPVYTDAYKFPFSRFVPSIPQVQIHLFHLTTDVDAGCHHHIQINTERLQPLGNRFCLDFLCVFFAHIDIVNRTDIIIFPPTYQRKCICFLIRRCRQRPHRISQFDICAQFRGNTQQL